MQRQLEARHHEVSLADPAEEHRLHVQHQLLLDRQVLHLAHRRGVRDPLLVEKRAEPASQAAWSCLQAGKASGTQHKLLAYDAMVSMLSLIHI